MVAPRSSLTRRGFGLAAAGGLAAAFTATARVGAADAPGAEGGAAPSTPSTPPNPPTSTGTTLAVFPTSPPAPPPVRIMPLGDSVTLGNSPPRSYRGFLQGHLHTAGYDFDFVGSYGNIIPPGGEAVWFGPDDSQRTYVGPLDIDFEGHGGFQAGQPQSVVGYPDHMLAQMIPTDLPRFAPDVVLVHIGTNDYLGGFTRHGPWHGPGGPGDRPIEFAARNVIDLIDAITVLRPEAVVLVAPIGKAGLNDIQTALSQISTLVRNAVELRARQGSPVAFVADLYEQIGPGDLADIVHPTDAGYAKMADAWFRALVPVLAARRSALAAAAAAVTPVATPPSVGAPVTSAAAPAR